MEAEYTGQIVDLLRPIEVAAASGRMGPFAYENEATSADCHPAPMAPAKSSLTHIGCAKLTPAQETGLATGDYTRRMTGRRILFHQVAANFGWHSPY